MKKQSAIRDIFKYYEPFWQEWQHYKFSGLDEADKYLVNSHRNLGFEYVEDDTIMFYNRTEIVNAVKHKLEDNFVKYQEWAIIKFQFALIRCTNLENFDSFLETKIAHLEFDKEITEILLCFNSETLDQLFLNYPEAAFKEEVLFSYILRFKQRLNELVRESKSGQNLLTSLHLLKK